MESNNRTPKFQLPVMRSFRRKQILGDPDDELGRSLKRIRLDSNGSTTSLTDQPFLAPTPGELCVRRDVRDSLVSGQLRVTSQSDTYIYGPNATLCQVEPTRFMFTFATNYQSLPESQTTNSRPGGVTTISISIPKRYPHHPPSLTLVSGSTGSSIAVEQQRLLNLISTTPNVTSGGASSHLWSPVHRLTDVLGWILHYYCCASNRDPVVVAEPQQQPLRLKHSRLRK